MKSVYVVDSCKGSVKVGIAKDLKKRINAIKTGSGLVGEIPVFSIDADDSKAEMIEQAVLTSFKDRLVNGEWVSATFEEVCAKVKSVSEVVLNPPTESKEFLGLSENFVSKTEVNLTSLSKEVNRIRNANGKSDYQLGAFLNSKMLADYLCAAAEEWNIPESSLLFRAKKSVGATICHTSIAVLFVESADVKLKAKMHKALIADWNHAHERQGGTEFKRLNATMAENLQCGKDEFDQIAKLIRSRILGDDAKTEDWNKASVPQIHLRYDWENKICEMLRLGVVRDYPHLKELVNNLEGVK